MTIASLAGLLFIALQAPALANDDVAPDLEAPLPGLDAAPADVADDDNDDSTSKTSSDDVTEEATERKRADRKALPPSDETPPVDDDEWAPWQWSTTMGSGIGAAIPSVLFGGSGTAIGGCGLFLIGSGVAQGGCGGLVLFFYGIVITMFAVPVMLAAALLTPLAAAIGALLGGALDDRFAWPSALGALLGFLPAFGAVGAVVGAFALATTVTDLTVTEGQIAGGFIIGALVVAAALVLMTGPVAVLGGVLGEMIADGTLSVEESEPEPAAVVNDALSEPPAPVESDADDVDAPPADVPSSSTPGAEPPPMFGPDMRY